MDYIKQLYSNRKVLLMYRCGSFAFGTSSEKSDEDYIVVLEGYKGLSHIGENGKEYWVFGLETWKQKMEFSSLLDKYYQIHNDEIFAFPDSVIAIDESMKPLVEEYQKAFPSQVSVWLKKVVAYYQKPVLRRDFTKRCYHLLRIQEEVKNFKELGSFSLVLSDKTKEKINAFKLAEDKSVYADEIIEAFEFLRLMTEG